MSTAWLEDHLGDGELRILDATVDVEVTTGQIESGRRRWESRHIPGSAFADLLVDLSEPDDRFAFTMPSANRFAVTIGSLAYAMAELATVESAAVVVEDRWADVFKLEYVQPGFVADLLATVQIRYPSVPIIFCETRPLAEEWTYRFLGAARAMALAEQDAEQTGHQAP